MRPATTQISLGIRPVWSESSLCTQWVAKDPSFFMRTEKTLIRLGGCPGWFQSSLGAQPHCWFCHEAAYIYVTDTCTFGKYLLSQKHKVTINHSGFCLDVTIGWELQPKIFTIFHKSYEASMRHCLRPYAWLLAWKFLLFHALWTVKALVRLYKLAGSGENTPVVCMFRTLFMLTDS